jgi:glycosyltransferase involved in cell wall biosynthesis
MNVYHVSSAPISGGAARSGLRLHQGLNQIQNVASLWLDAGGTPDVSQARHLGQTPKSATLGTRFGRYRWRRRLLRNFCGATTPYTTPLGWGAPGLFENLPRPDIWHLQWVSGFLDWERLLPWMAEQAPIVWTLHDLNPLMGVWHYLPSASESNPEREAAEREAMEIKRQALARIPKERLTFVGPSQWMVEQCRQSPVTGGFPVCHIPYGLDTEVFTPRDKQVMRSMYGIADDEQVLGFVADQLADPRKGMAQLAAAIASLPASVRVRLLTVGNGHSPQFQFPHHHLGGIQSDHVLSFFYSACDVFVCPSLQDNLPNTVLEALACGTPVVGYDTGGLPDMIVTGATGAIASPVGSSPALGTAIAELLSNGGRLAEMRAQARSRAMAQYTLGSQAWQYHKLYSKLIG